MHFPSFSGQEGNQIFDNRTGHALETQ